MKNEETDLLIDRLKNKLDTPVVYSKFLSEKFVTNVWLKLEMLNKTGSHKDRESISIVQECIKKGYQQLGCATTGNFGVSMAYYSNLLGLEFHAWVPFDIPKNMLDLMNKFNAVIHHTSAPYHATVQMSIDTLRVMGAFNINPGCCNLKIIAHQSIADELKDQVHMLKGVVCPVNNGSLLLGLHKGLDSNIQLFGVTSDANFASSIKGFNCAEGEDEVLNAVRSRGGCLVRASEEDIRLSLELFAKEELYVEPSSAAVIVALKSIDFDEREHICCVVTGSEHKEIVNA